MKILLLHNFTVILRGGGRKGRRGKANFVVSDVPKQPEKEKEKG